jgi:hypothetical protein
VEHASLWLDVKILLLTFKAVAFRENINFTEAMAMPEFCGTMSPDAQQIPTENNAVARRTLKRERNPQN